MTRMLPFALLSLLVACDGEPQSVPAGDAGLRDVADGGSVRDVPPDAPWQKDAEPDLPELRDASPDAAAEIGDATPEVRDAMDEEGDADAREVADAPEAETSPDSTDAADTSDTADTPEPGPWRSALYPEDWTPEHTDAEGRFLHDFSWAGYRNGEAPPGQDLPEATFDVVADFEADPSGEADATAEVQAAIDAAEEAGGGIVWFRAGLYRFDGLLRITGSRVVLRGAGPEESRLWFTRHEGMSFDDHVRFQGARSEHDEALLAADGASRSHVIEVEDASAYAPGDDVVIGQGITEAFQAEHGMVDTWQAFDGTWQPFFRRDVVAVDTESAPHRITVDVPLRYPMKVAHEASVRRVEGLLTECGFESLGVANAVGWDAAWEQDQVHVLAMRGVKDCWVRDVATFPSPGAPTEGDGAGAHLQSSGIIVRQSKRVTLADSRMAHAQNRGGGGNGYLFEVRQSSELLTRDSVAVAGRHNFIQNWGFGLTGCVWLRVDSREGATVVSKDFPWTSTGLSEFHHSLATANLIDSSEADDGWGAVNRRDWSSGAGHTATETAFWNVRGTGSLRSRQFGHGYVIGTGPEVSVLTHLDAAEASGTAPEDWTEGLGEASTLEPASLYDDQLERRLGEPSGR